MDEIAYIFIALGIICGIIAFLVLHKEKKQN